ncbi:MAG: protein kinase [Gemmatimonadales bacterium]|nr:protein kinase [Gemmatimonadales bacterium]NIQ98636.1 protein kinase [Gemmatimonadales bacterium]
MLAIRLLGPVQVSDPAGRVLEELLRQPKRVALLAYLAVAEPRGFHRRDTLLGLFWPESPAKQARLALSQALHFLRHHLGGDAILTRGEGEVALKHAVVSCDVWAFREAVAAGNHAQAVSLYGGLLLAGFSTRASAEWEHWLDGARDRLARANATSLEQLALQADAEGDALRAVSLWRQLAEVDPYATRVTVRLIAALDVAGDRAGALQVADQHGRRLKNELGAEPSPEVEALARRLRAGPSPTAPEPGRSTRQRLARALAGRYQLDRVLGAGGMALVYLADDLKLGRQVAIKVLRPELAAAIGRERFLNEVDIAAGLAHPNILPLHDFGEGDGLLYYVMPYVEGESLRDRLAREGPPAVEEALRIAREVADALAHAHAQGIVHRDIKPANILLLADHAVVSDFGVARAVGEAAEDRALLATTGTPVYMSPEQAAGSPDLDARSDLYSLGCVLYEMLVGEPPYTGPTAQAIIARHAVDPVPSLRTLRATVPDALEQVVTKALAKVPADRYVTGEELADALTTASAETPTWQASKTARISRRVVAGAVAAAVVLAGVVVGLLLVGGESPLDRRRVVVFPLENQTGDSSLDVVGKTAADFATRGLPETGLLQVVPTASALPSGRADAAGDSTRDAQANVLRWAKQTGAGTLVHGSYFRHGDSLRFQVQILDVRSGNVIRNLDPIPAAISDPMPGIAALRQDVMGVLASVFDPDFPLASPEVTIPTHTPTWDAYRAFTAGLDLLRQSAGMQANDYFILAAERDSLFTIPLLLIAISYDNTGQHALADSMARVVAAARDRLGALDRLGLDWLLARLDGDHSRALAATREMARMAPGSGWVYLAALDATRVNRPREAIALLGGLDHLVVMRLEAWWVVTCAHHMLGDYRRELKAARRPREEFPDNLITRLLEIRALAALGRVSEATERIDDALALPPSWYIPATWYIPANLLQDAALEFRAHGHPGVASEMLDRLLARLADVPAEDAQSWEHRYAVAEAHYLAERWREATTRFRALAEESPDDPNVQGYLGVLAARRGDTVEAEGVSQWLRDLKTPFLFGRHTYWRARISAQLGRLDRGVTLLRTALSEGLRHPYFQPYWGIHVERDFEPLHDHSGFQELMRPRG